MPSKKIRFHEGALSEARTAYAWYASKDPVAADAFIEELDHAIEQIESFPDAGTSFVMGTRRRVMRRIPFTIICRQHKKATENLAVAHGRRKPGYWKERVKN